MNRIIVENNRVEIFSEDGSSISLSGMDGVPRIHSINILRGVLTSIYGPATIEVNGVAND